jgi:isopenicillin-N epimerase
VEFEQLLLARRDLLVRTGLLAGSLGFGGLAAACDSGKGSAAASTPSADLASWAGVRSQFALDPKVRHFAAFLLASHPKPVRDAIERHREDLDADPAGYLHDNQLSLEGKVAEAAAAYLGGDPADFALTDSTTMGLGLLYGGVKLEPGQEVLTTEHDFYSTHESLRLRAERTGATVRRVRLFDDPVTTSEEEIVSRVTAAVRPETRVLALTWVHSSTGLKLPIASIGRALADRTARDRLLVCVDAVHALGAEEIALDDLGIDFLITGCHKWLFGPRGTGIVWGAGEAWQACEATIPSFSDNDEYIAWLEAHPPTKPTSALAMTPGGFHSFEHRWALADGFDFQRSLGMDRVAARTRELATRLKEGLRAIKGLTLYTPMDEHLSAGLVCFELADERPEATVERLGASGIVASVTPYATPYVRLGTTVLVSEDDVDAAVAAVAKAA